MNEEQYGEDGDMPEEEEQLSLPMVLEEGQAIHLSNEELALYQSLLDAAAQPPLSSILYDHGGGRLFKGNDLIADCFDKGNRNFYFNAHRIVARLLQEVHIWRAEKAVQALLEK